MRARERLAVLVVAALTTPGCLACRPSAPLDAAECTELASIRDRLRARGVRIVAPLEPPTDWHDGREILLAVEGVRLESYRRVDAPRPGDVALGVRRVPRESDTGSIWGAALSTLTLGIVPYFGDAGTSLTIRWSAPNGANDVGARESTCAGEVPTVFGWIAPVIAAREGWRLGGPPTEGTDERHAGLARLGLCVARSLDAYVGECGVTRGSR